MYYKEGVTDPDYCVLKFTAFREDIIVGSNPRILVLSSRTDKFTLFP